MQASSVKATSESPYSQACRYEQVDNFGNTVEFCSVSMLDVDAQDEVLRSLMIGKAVIFHLQKHECDMQVWVEGHRFEGRELLGAAMLEISQSKDGRSDYSCCIENVRYIYQTTGSQTSHYLMLAAKADLLLMAT